MDNDSMRNLSAAVILRAVDDWRHCVEREKNRIKTGADPFDIDTKHHRVNQSGFEEIRNFFKGDYGSSLCEIVGLDSVTILRKLERERAVALRSSLRAIREGTCA